MQLLTSILMGVGLSAASGFRAFLPLLGMSLFALSGQLELTEEFSWVGTQTALITLSAATVLEITAYYVPRVEEMLSKIAVPVSIAAGSIVTASCVVGMNPLLRWGLAIIAGGSVSGAVKTELLSFRQAARTESIGAAGLIVTTLEVGAALIMTAAVIAVPYLLVLIALLILYFMHRRSKVEFA
jgi:hypothetical protein